MLRGSFGIGRWGWRPSPRGRPRYHSSLFLYSQPSTKSNACHVRHFFFGSSGGSGDDDDDSKDKDTPSDVKDSGKLEDKNDTNKKGGATSSKAGPSLNNSAKHRKVSPRRTSFSSSDIDGESPGPISDVMLPASSSRLGFGDQAPKYPHLLALPIARAPVFPGILTPLTVTDKATIKAVENTLDGAGYLGLFLRKDQPDVAKGLEKPEVITSEDDLYRVGTFAQIQRLTKANAIHGDGAPFAHEVESGGDDDEDDDNPASLLLMPHRRINLISVDGIGPPVDVTVSHWERLTYTRGKDSVRDDTIRALSQEVLATIREVAQLNSLFKEQVVNLVPSSHLFDMADPFRLADFAASLSNGNDVANLQAVLEEEDPELRLHKALELLSKEREVSKLQKEISAKVEEKMSEAQRKYFLTEQLKSIKKELGMEKDDKETLIEKYRKKLAEYPEIPAEINETIEAEIEKLSTLEKNSAEFSLSRTYLDWLTAIPWGVTTQETFDIVAARQVLDRDHYGMDEVKETILQFIAVGKLKGSVQGKILCLAGPPGTGKTSIAKGVAEALGRKYYRFSVGGLSDVSEIKGHRRTYVGAMPGKIVQCLKSTGSSNPLVLIDEIDKLGKDFRGDPSSALLEVLDPSQNSSFRDHFIDVGIDISKALFLCTANDTSLIPGPLLDRMEVINMSGYDVPEKLEIASKYLVPKSMVNSGLMVDATKATKEDGAEEEPSNNKIQDPIYELSDLVPESLSIQKSALESLVRWYCREAGVRNLAKKIDKITGLLSLQVVAEDEEAQLTEKSKRQSDTWEVSADNLSDYVGKPIFTSDRLYDSDPLPHGIVMGLAYTSMGGSALYIESQGIRRAVDKDGNKRGGGTLKVTGQLGDVMKESAEISYTVARARLAEIDPASTFFDDTDIHLHVPEGATPKDGPSAGITMVTSMLSLALDRPIKSDLAMTGEVSLTGKVMAVGGIKEKVMAARRAGIRTLVLPADCKRDFDELADYLKDGLGVHYAREYSDVYQTALGDSSEPES